MSSKIHIMGIKILYITYDGLTDPLGQSQVLPYLRQLSDMGYQFTILSFEKRDRFAREENIIRQITAEAGIDWIPLTFTANPPLLSKYRDRSRLLRTASRLYKRHRYRIIHCRSYVAAEAGLYLKKKFGAAFLFDMRGFWADEKVDNGQWDQRNPLYRAIYRHYKKKEREFLRHADGIVSLTQAACDHIHSEPEFGGLQPEIIPCCADLDHFNYAAVDPEEVRTMREKMGLNGNTRVITYLGSVGGWYMIREMFDFFSELKKTFPEYKMLVLTKDKAEDVLAAAAGSGIQPGDIRVIYSDRKTLPVYLAMTNVSIFFIRNSFSKMASSPTKHAELMAMGIPVICNDIGDTGNIIRETGTGVLVERFDRAGYAEMVSRLPEITAISRDGIRRHAAAIFDLRAGSEKYHRLYQRILNQQGR